MSNLIWAQNILERVDGGESVSETDLAKASDIVMAEVNKHKPKKKKEALPKFAKNQVELAKCFQVDRKTIQRWRKEEEKRGRSVSILTKKETTKQQQ